MLTDERYRLESVQAEILGLAVAFGDAQRNLTSDDPYTKSRAVTDVLTFAALTAAGIRAVRAGASGRVAGPAPKAPSVLQVGEVKLSAVPEGVVGTPVSSSKGLEYAIPRGTPELDPRVTSIRIMDPVTTGKYQYPNGYAVYMNASGQTVNPLSGKTIGFDHPFAHIPLQ